MSFRLRLLVVQLVVMAVVLGAAWVIGVPARLWLILALIAAAAVLGGTLWLSRYVDRTLTALALGTQRIAAGQFSPITLSSADPDVAPLVTSFNEMVTTLQSRDQQLQRYHFDQAQRVRELDALVEISRNVNSSLNGRAVLRTILNETVKSFPTARKALIHLVDDSHQRLVPVALSDTNTPLKQTMGMPLDQGIAGRCVREKRTITVSDTKTHPDFIDLGSNVRALMVTPLIIGERVIGALSIDSIRKDAFSPDMETVFHLLADRAANAIENARLFEESQTRVKELTKLLQLMTELSSQGDMDSVYHQLVRGSINMLDAQEGVLLLKSPMGGMQAVFQLPATNGSNGKFVTLPPVLDHVVQTSEPLIFDRGTASVEVPRPHIGNGMAAPLMWKGGVLGVIAIFKRNAPYFEGAHLGLLALFAQHGAGVLENMRLVSELQGANRDLSRASQLKSEFLANMSHELRTPLNAILGFSEILIDQTFGELNERQSKYLNNIHNSGRHLLDLINDILDLSKIEAGRMELQVEPFRLDGAIHEVYTILESLAAKKQLTIQLDTAATPMRITADRLRFKQILYNILSNAVKFTPDGGTISVRSWSESDSAGMPQVFIAVTDTGLGIPADQHESIFDMFHRLDQSYRSATEGTGLGLALVRRFTQLHGGDVWVESEVGHGSTFTIRIPQDSSEQVVVSSV